MANPWFSVCAVLITVNLVFGNDCSNMMRITSCDECIRCGGLWCNDPTYDTSCIHSSDTRRDTWCPTNKEKMDAVLDRTESGIKGGPNYKERNVHVGGQSLLRYDDVEPKVKIINTTQTDRVHYNTILLGGNKWHVEVLPDQEFCTPKGKTLEHVYLEVDIGNFKEIVKYNVPCACPCSEKAEVLSTKCSNRGTYSCGVCTCPSGWHGKFCEKRKCEGIRGDLQCTNPAMNDRECSGNGYCGPCETCECYTDRPGSKYFDKDDYCADICMTANNCDECLGNPALGFCAHCQVPLTKLEYKESLMAERDSLNRSVWVTCNGTINDCQIEYAAMKDENKDLYIMLIRGCDPSSGASVAGTVNVTVPVVVTVLLIAAAAAATAGYLVWKSRPPPLPLADTQYQNIGAEDCAGVNPLYKPPTSYYNNPTYGKN